MPLRITTLENDQIMMREIRLSGLMRERGLPSLILRADHFTFIFAFLTTLCGVNKNFGPYGPSEGSGCFLAAVNIKNPAPGQDFFTGR